MKACFIFSFLLSFVIVWPANSQCNSELIDIAVAQSGPDAVFVREFKVNLPAASLKNPVPVGKFNVYLKQNTLYRFNIAAGKESTGEAVLQLFDKGILVASTTAPSNLSGNKPVNITSPRTGSFQVIISFRDGKPGCAVGIMSLVQSTALMKDSIASVQNDEMEILYLETENPISIVTDKTDTDSILLEIDNGTILKRLDGSYAVIPVNEGIATLKATIKTKEGKLKEEAKSNFLVRRLPQPYATLQGIRGGLINRSSLQLADYLEIDNPVAFEKIGYVIVDFKITLGDKGGKRQINSGKKFSPATRSFLQEVPEDTKLIIDEIRVQTPSGKIIMLESLGFIVR